MTALLETWLRQPKVMRAGAHLMLVSGVLGCGGLVFLFSVLGEVPMPEGFRVVKGLAAGGGLAWAAAALGAWRGLREHATRQEMGEPRDQRALDRLGARWVALAGVAIVLLFLADQAIPFPEGRTLGQHARSLAEAAAAASVLGNAWWLHRRSSRSTPPPG